MFTLNILNWLKFLLITNKARFTLKIIAVYDLNRSKAILTRNIWKLVLNFVVLQ